MLDGLGVVVSILSAAIKVSKAWEAEGLDASEVEALGAVHAALTKAAGLDAPAPSAPELELDRLLTGVFGEALGGYALVDDVRTVPDRLRRWWSGEAAGAHDEVGSELRGWGRNLVVRWRTERGGLEETLRARLETVLTAPPTGAGGEPPLGLPLYRALRRAVNDPALGDPLVADQDWPAFERDVLYGWQRRISRREDLRAWLKMNPEREALRLWELALREQADWGDRHVFGNRRRGEDDGGVRHVALDEIYVEPVARRIEKGKEDAAEGPLLAAIQRHLERGPVVVRADFGMGKSLSARRLARDLSRAWLGSGQGWLPLYVRCADDLGERRFRKEAVIRPALRRILRAAGLDVADDETPDRERPGSRTLIILDGLDEVELGRADLATFFKEVDGAWGTKCRIIVLSRPGALPDTLPERFTVLEVQPLGAGQVEDWLKRWRAVVGAGPDRQGLEGRGLSELAATPILLFMIAWTWGELAEGDDVGALYERFMRSLAHGKFERDRETHPVVARAASTLAERLRRKNYIEVDDPVDAMLWLLARAAWRARELAARRPPRSLDTHELGALIRELDPDLESGVFDAVRLGVLLALQVDPHGGTARVFFGHRSFAEYLCARFWELTLRRGLRIRPRKEENIAILGDAPLAMMRQEGDRAHEFLLGRLGAWPVPERERLFDWTFVLLADPPSRSPYPTDLGWALRRLLLAACSPLEGWPGWDVREEDVPTLRALLMWSWVTGWEDRLVVRGLKVPRGTSLHNLVTWDADLSGAILSGANLSGADLSGADLSGADLSGARFHAYGPTRWDSTTTWPDGFTPPPPPHKS